MRLGTLLSNVPGTLFLLAILSTPLTGMAQDQGARNPVKQDQVKQDQPAMTQKELEKAFWPAWNKFISDITESNINHNPDPWESWNRKVFAFNDVADRWVLKPVAKGYRWITPDVVETGISNVFSNLFEITTIVNDLLQFKFLQAGSDTGRFLVNSTVGLAGLFDVATPLGLTQHDEDFGQTLGYWGVGSGPFIEVPFFGPYTLRSGTGSLIESQTTDPTYRVEPARARNQVWAGHIISKRANLLKAEQLITGDRYTFIRDAYLQQRQYLVNDGKVKDTFGEQDYEDDWLDQLDQKPQQSK